MSPSACTEVTTARALMFLSISEKVRYLEVVSLIDYKGLNI